MEKFNSTRNKLNKLWQADQKNENDTDNLSIVNKSHESFNQKKGFRSIILIDDLQCWNYDEQTWTQRLEKFAEKNIATTNVILQTRTLPAYVRQPIESSYATHNISYDNVWVEKSFTRIDEDVYDLNITYKAYAQILNEVPLGYFYSKIPLYITLSIYFFNTNSYIASQSEGQ